MTHHSVYSNTDILKMASDYVLKDKRQRHSDGDTQEDGQRRPHGTRDKPKKIQALLTWKRTTPMARLMSKKQAA